MKIPLPVSLPVVVRAYVPNPNRRKRRADSSAEEPSRWTLIFDTETNADAAQNLRFGSYQVRESDELREEGLFIDAHLPDDDLAVLRAYAEEHEEIRLLSLSDFIEEVFYYYVYDLRALCVGFNLPFDISRIALGHDSARRAMKGGFTFLLSDKRSRPRIQIKHLNSRTSLIRFGWLWKQLTPRGMRKRGIVVGPHRGFFLDVKSLAGGILGDSWSLKRLAEHLRTPHQKLETDYHGPIDRPFVEYARADVYATWECFQQLRDRYLSYGLSKTPAHRIYSEASLGKAYLRQMNVRPWREVQPRFSPELLGAILSTYYGGRAEVRIRRKRVRVVYCDFMSMYPTVCTLMGLWQFVVASGMTPRNSTRETRALLARIDLVHLQQPDAWRLLRTIVQVQPDGDILPVRAEYGEILPGHDPERPPQHSIGLNHLTSEEGLWYTLADCIASAVLTGRAPKVLRAVTFEPGPQQKNLTPIRIAGNDSFSVDPAQQDFYKRLIELRIKTKERKGDRAQRDAEAQALKNCANATSYGIFPELNVTDLDNLQRVDVFGSGEPFSTSVKSLENEGRYFHPLLGTLITGAARLMIAIAERLAADEGISWAFCDTDSLALAQPEGMSNEEFLLKVERVREWFTALSPYEGKPDLFKMEDENFRIAADKSPKQLEPLFCWAVSAKRHALFNLDTDGRPVIRKASGHGLGHLQDPYSETDAPVSIPVPRVPLAALKVHRWQHDFWFRIVEAGLSENPDWLKLEDIPGFERRAASRYAATTPTAARWFWRYNLDKPYREQVRPFGFVLAFPARKAPFQFDGQIPSGKGAKIRPVAPHGPVEIAALHAFDRETGERVPPELLLTYSQVLSRYHIHPEDKFENADYDDRGTTIRRHIRVHGIEHIGKESNRWEDRWHLGSDADSKVSYGSSPENLKRTKKAIQSAVRLFGVRRVAAKAGMSPAGISGFTRGKANLSPGALVRIRSALVFLREESDRSAANRADLRKRLAVAAERRISIWHLAQMGGFDPANLRKAVRGLRPLSPEMRARLEKILADLNA
jgi:hypothetical protein